MKKQSFLPGILLLLFCGSLHATIIHVPADYSQIQQAILASVNGDTVLVSPGTYYENINFRGKNIVLTSRFYEANDTSFITSTIINGSQPANQDTASCIILNSGEDSTAVIQGFSITGGAGTVWLDVHGAGTYREGGGIITEFSSPLIQYNLIHDNIVMNTTGVASTGGGGIRSGDGNPTIRHNVICHNQGRYGGGIVFNYASGIVENNIIAYNSGGQSHGGGGLWGSGTDSLTVVHVENNTIVNNQVTGTSAYGGKGGAIQCFSMKFDLYNNILWGNTQSAGGPISTFFGGVVRATNCDIQGNFPGSNNLDVNPLFADSVSFLLSIGSPCIDAGLPGSTFFDPQSESIGVAAFPSLGTLRNDMGVYGGHGSVILPHCPGMFTGINSDRSNRNFSVDVYPNPAHSDVVLVRASKNFGKDVLISIYDYSGREIYSRKFSSDSLMAGEQLSLSGFGNGIYTLRYTCGESRRVLKLLVVKN
ncbi:MAG TPA: T9SS type A sorting domain-containing protein [Bacteroidia bacterium]|mgnify:CR=1 FL=1|nr:T9SS type A sorting domain-containing protein [Bacteroidia bacterium]